MNFDTVLMAAVGDEVGQVLLGARIDKVSQPEPLEVVIALYHDNARRNLLISCDPNTARIHFIRQRGRPGPMAAPSFCMLLRKYLEGGVVEEISQPLGFSERVLQIKVRSATRQKFSLWVELMGRQSNLVLTNDAGTILGSIKRVTSDMSRFREIRAGIQYTPPPRQLGYKRDPMDIHASFGLSPEPFAGPDEAEKWLTATFRGVGSLLAKEAVLRSASDPLSPETVWYGLNEILTLVRTNEFAAVLCRDENGQPLLAYPFPVKSIPESRQEPADSISAALEAVFGAREDIDVLEKERSALLAALRRAAKAAERQLLDVREGLVNSDQSEYIKESGELLLANIATIPPGAKEVSVEDYFAEDPDERRTIDLDPSLTAHENAERFFRRYQKARDSKDILLKRQEELERSVIEIDKAIAEADAATTQQELLALSERVGEEVRINQTPGTHGPAARPTYEGHKIKSLKSPDGWEILVGENSTSNDYLTTRVASPSDIWLHARAVPSAHAVIRAQNRPAAVSTAAILLAAKQVAMRSQAKHAGLVSVDYTLKKYVRKPRGSAPGQVTYANEKTIDVVADGE